jgi:hypothetical protein
MVPTLYNRLHLLLSHRSVGAVLCEFLASLVPAAAAAATPVCLAFGNGTKRLG